MTRKIDEIQHALGGKLISDPYPYLRSDRKTWLDLLVRTSRKSIGLYGVLMQLRGIGATLEKSEKFGYIIKPIYKDGTVSWGFPSEDIWEQQKKGLVPYRTVLLKLLKELREDEEICV